jgi:pre-mRNA-processing factor 39
MSSLPTAPRSGKHIKQISLGTSPADDPEWRRATETVDNDPDNLELWEILIQATEKYTVDGSHASGAVKDITRSVFERFLTKFPLLFGYWIKFAEIEQGFWGQDAARRVYEQAVAAFPVSVDLWSQYGTFLASINDAHAAIVFQRGAELVGRDFLSHPFWDKYLEYENSVENESRQVAIILKKIIAYPLHQYARYYERCTQLAQKYPDLFEDVNLEQIFMTTQAGTTDRWMYESKITRSYFHVVELEKDQINNWNAYLDYEESQGDFEQTRFLYERALVPNALYDTFWLRYVRWMSLFDRQEDTRNIYRRACSVFVPISRPQIRFQWALYEESLGNIDFARDILESLQATAQTDLEEAFIYRVDFEKRVGMQSVMAYIDFMTSNRNLPLSVVAVLIAMKAVLVWQTGDNDGAEQIFNNHKQEFLDSSFFLINYFKFALSTGNLDRLHSLWTLICVQARIPPTVISDISKLYLEYLLENGHMKEYFEVDIETHGPFTTRKLLKKKLGESTDQRLLLENGHPGVEIDPVAVVYEKKNPFKRYLVEQGIEGK